MSQFSTARGFWFRYVDPTPARQRLRRAVSALARARRLQMFVDHGFCGLFAGLVLATVAVLAARLIGLPYAPLQVAGTAVIAALAVALFAGWRRPIDALDVVIRADLVLKLKQRLSTAWEFMSLGADDELTERLAVQAVKAGLPDRPRLLFPLRVNRWGRLAPLAATALLLTSVVDIDRMQGSAPLEVDEKVVGEGRSLGAYGREMQERARRNELPRSGRQAAWIERLGARMESGALSRDQALEQLRRTDEALDEERRQALAEANPAGGGAQRAESGEGLPGAAGLNPQAMLDRMGRGAPGDDDFRALVERLDDLERSGIPRRDLENALGRHRAGDDDALKEVLERLVQFDRARKEGRELGRARAQLRRARESLGESLTDANRGNRPGTDIDWDDEEGDRRGGSNAEQPATGARFESGMARDARRAGSQGDSGAAASRQRSPLLPESAKSGPVLAPQGQIGEGEGEVFTSQGRARPRVTRPGVENVPMRSEFASQVEEVLSNEQYPAHYKAFVRRYFLNLSQGRRDADPQSPGTRGAP